MKNIYEKTKIPVKTRKNIYKDEKTPVNQKGEFVFLGSLRKVFEPVIEAVQSLNTQINKVENLEVQLKGTFPEVQKVEVQNKPVEIQKVEVTNPTKEVILPEVQKVEVTNPKEVKFPEVQKVVITNPQKEMVLPLGKGNDPKSADPEKYLNVRLTDGKKFYKALDEYYVSSGGGQSKTSTTSADPADIQYDPNDSQPTYLGTHLVPGASDDDPNWTIFKYTYSGSDTTRIQKRKGAWSNRATIF